MINMIVSNRVNHGNLVIMSEFQAAWSDAMRILTTKSTEDTDRDQSEFISRGGTEANLNYF